MKKAAKKIEVKSRLPIRVVIRGANYEFSAEAPAFKLSEELEELRKLNQVIARTLSGATTAPVRAPGPELVFDEAPSIKAASSTTENITALFETPWGRNPRTVADVIKALETNAVPDNPDSVATYLARLVKKQILRRVRKAGKYQYYKVPSG
jgi:predicted transcriptional regulator